MCVCVCVRSYTLYLYMRPSSPCVSNSTSISRVSVHENLLWWLRPLITLKEVFPFFFFLFFCLQFSFLFYVCGLLETLDERERQSINLFCFVFSPETIVMDRPLPTFFCFFFEEVSTIRLFIFLTILRLPLKISTEISFAIKSVFVQQG